MTVIGPQRFVDRAIVSFRIAPFSTAPRATKIALSSRTIAAGATVPGVVVVVNNTGAPLSYGGCGGLFAIGVTKPGEAPDLAWLGCLQQLTVPEGESSYPSGARAAASGCSTGPVCPLPPGEYDAVLAQNGSDFPDAEPIPVRVIAAPPG